MLKKGAQRNDSGQWTAAGVERRLREGRGDGRASDERDDEDDGGGVEEDAREDGGSSDSLKKVFMGRWQSRPASTGI